MKNMKKSVITAASVLMLGSVLLPSHLTALAAPSGAQQSTAVTKDQAKEIAASKAGLSVSDLSFFWMEKEWDDGRLCYEGEFVHKTTEYEFEIDVNTGTVTEWDTESSDDSCFCNDSNAETGSFGQGRVKSPALSFARAPSSSIFMSCNWP